MTDRYEVNEDDQDCKDEASDEYGDDESDRDGDGGVQDYGHVPSFLTINQLMKNEQERNLSMDVLSCDLSNTPDPEDLDHEDPDERGTVNYYLAPSSQFENVEDFGNIVSSD